MTFDFFNVPRIVFGRGAIARLGELVPADARVMLVYNGRKPDALPTAAVEFRQRGEPTVADVDAALAVAREANVDFVLGVGGGSAIDAAKAVAGLLGNGGVATDYMEVVGRGQKLTKPAVPWIAIPTTAGTGAEVTRNAVIGWPEKKFKASIRSELLMARVALIDPELHVDVPPHVTASSGADALCQCIEAYVSRGANPMTDAVAIKGVDLWDIDRVFPDERRLGRGARLCRAARGQLSNPARHRVRAAPAARDPSEHRGLESAGGWAGDAQEVRRHRSRDGRRSEQR
jgi:alcohol dehydrogenase class IV